MSYRPLLPEGLSLSRDALLPKTPIEAPDDLLPSDGEEVSDFLKELLDRQDGLIGEFRIRGLIHVYLTKILPLLRPETAKLQEINVNSYGSSWMREELTDLGLNYDELYSWAKNLQPLAVVRDEYDAKVITAFQTFLGDPTLLPSDLSRMAGELRKQYHQASHSMSWESYWSNWSLKMNCQNRSHENDHRLDFLAVYDEMKGLLGETPLFEITINWCLIQDDAGREGLNYLPSIRMTNSDKMFNNDRALEIEYYRRFFQRGAAMPNPSHSDIYKSEHLTKLFHQPSV